MTKPTAAKVKTAADKIIDKLSEDILDRHTLKHIWREIDEDVMNEDIIPEWRRIITEQIKELLK
jgi:hypothetical protein